MNTKFKSKIVNEKMPLERITVRREGNIKMDLDEIRCEGVD